MPPAASERFVTASIKPSSGRIEGKSGPDRYVRLTSLNGLLEEAFELPSFLLAGLPTWASDAWEISATSARPRSKEELRPLLRALLQDRFALRAHVESREMDVYELVAARADGRGPGLKPSTGECRGFTNIGRLTSDGPPDPAWPTCMHGMMTGRRSISSRLGGYSVPQFARMLQRPAGRPVLDKTGREGLFDFLFDVTLVVDAASDIRPLDTALRESFGLTLQSARRAVDVLVIDSVSQPTQN